jgi:hypothetical protein
MQICYTNINILSTLFFGSKLGHSVVPNCIRVQEYKNKIPNLLLIFEPIAKKLCCWFADCKKVQQEERKNASLNF